MNELIKLYDHPVKIEIKKISLYREKKMQEEARRHVERAINQWLYNGLQSEQ
mgnify:CR=1 FL=1